MRLKYNEIASCLGIAPVRDDIALTSVVTDSRESRPGSLFVCIPGSHVDGHDYVSKAVQMGASAVLASRNVPDAQIPVLYVSDTVKALGQIAALWRGKTKAKVVGVTGTAGKTTVKELLAQVFAVHAKTARNEMNYNNQIGMPRAMLTTDGDEDFWVMEAGISRSGDMEELAQILRPDLGIILNAGSGHLEGLGDKGVAWHKSRLLAWLSSEFSELGCGLVNADFPDLVREAKNIDVPLHFFSATGQEVEYRGTYEGKGPCGARGQYRLWLNGECCTVLAPFCGEFGAENAIAVAAAAHLLGLTSEEIVEGFARATTTAGRFNTTHLHPWHVIDDTYNANPLSMKRMLDAGLEMADGRALVAVLGDMLELGEYAQLEHEKLGRYLAELGPAAVIWKGEHAGHVRTGLCGGGYTGSLYAVNSVGGFLAAWADLLRTNALCEEYGGVLLFKGSRANRLEELFTAFCRQAGNVMNQGSNDAVVKERVHVL